MGGYVGTVNALFTLRKVRCMVDWQLVDSGLVHVGAIMGHSVRIGAACMIFPGRYLPPGTVTAVNSIYSESGDIVRSSRKPQAQAQSPSPK